MYRHLQVSKNVAGSAVAYGLLPRYPRTMCSPHRVSAQPLPPRYTPSLEPDSAEYSSPVDDYLTTPDVAEWREARILEYEKDRNLACDAWNHMDLPALEFRKPEPVVSESPPELPVWPYTTIAPKDAFPDYAQVLEYLKEQARPTSPVSEYELAETEDSVSADNASSPRPSSPSPLSSPLPSPLPCPVRSVGTKSKREDDEDEDEDADEPSPKRARHKPQRFTASDVDSDDDSDDDGSGCFQPLSRPVKARPSTRRPTTKPGRRPALRKAIKTNRGEDYHLGPCDCRKQGCPHCTMTCFYTFVHGERKGGVCRRLFEKNRHLDLKRHKAAHAVQEWKLLEDGDIEPDEAHWHLVVFEGKEHGLICPNGDCSTTFTRYDALKRHMERGTCLYGGPAIDDGDNRKLKAQIMKASNEKRLRLAKTNKTA